LKIYSFDDSLSMNRTTFSFERFSLPMNRMAFLFERLSLPMNRRTFWLERLSLTPALSRWERENGRPMA
jgi:hypothetical protein